MEMHQDWLSLKKLPTDEIYLMWETLLECRDRQRIAMEEEQKKKK